MTRREIIEKLIEVKELLVTEVGAEDITDYAREKAYMCIVGAIDYIEENYE